AFGHREELQDFIRRSICEFEIKPVACWRIQKIYRTFRGQFSLHCICIECLDLQPLAVKGDSGGQSLKVCSDKSAGLRLDCRSQSRRGAVFRTFILLQSAQECEVEDVEVGGSDGKVGFWCIKVCHRTFYC